MLLTRMVRSRMPGMVMIGMCSVAVVDNVLVDFVGDGQRVEFLAQRRDEFELLAIENAAGGIIRRITE